MAEGQARFGEPHLIRPRLGQGAFRVLVTDIYERRCAVTQERTLPALEAAHIRPYGDGGAHEAENGLLLRRDIHSLFDAGYVTVTPENSISKSAAASGRSSKMAGTTTNFMAGVSRCLLTRCPTRSCFPPVAQREPVQRLMDFGYRFRPAPG